MTMLRLTLPGGASKGVITYTSLDTGKLLFEGDMRQCCHCQKVWTYKPGSRAARGFCTQCNGHVCGAPGCMDCYPAEQRLDDIETLAYRRKKKMIDAAYARQRRWAEKA